MPAFPGNTPPVVLWMDNASASTNLVPAFAFDPLTRALAGSSPLATAPSVTHQPVAITGALAGAAGAGFQFPNYGELWFERIHVLPQKKSYPFIVSSQHVFVEVYNAFRATPQSVANVVLSGPVGVSILTPIVTPIAFGPLQSRLYDVLVAANGAARAQNTILWDFTGLAEPLFTVTGLRLLPFTISPDWDAGIDDFRAWITNIFTADDDTEQREALRFVPRRSYGYRAAALEDREGGLLQSLVWSWQGRSYGVLMWQDAMPLQVDLPADSQDVLVDTTNMGLVVGDTVILISDAFTWFASPIIELTAVSLKLDTPTDQGFFSANTQVIPLKMGRMAAQVPIVRPNTSTSVMDIKFDLQVVAS
jgi:hypothetical protein